MNNEIKVGDVVCLKSSPNSRFTVAALIGTDKIRLTYIDENTGHQVNSREQLKVLYNKISD